MLCNLTWNCCNILVVVVLNVRFAMDKICMKNNAVWHEQAIIECSWHAISADTNGEGLNVFTSRCEKLSQCAISIVACCESVKLCALVAQTF